jgi:hypothetical protein
MMRASDILALAAKDRIVQHRGALADREAKSLSALGVLAWKAGALYAENGGEWRIEQEIFIRAYGWGPGTEPSDGEYYFDGFDSLSPEEQE